jgi:hypothetical protein
MTARHRKDDPFHAAFANLPADPSRRLDALFNLNKKLRRALADQLQPVVRTLLQEKPPEDDLGRRELAHRLNYVLRDFGLTIIEPGQGQPCTVVAEPYRLTLQSKKGSTRTRAGTRFRGLKFARKWTLITGLATLLGPGLTALSIWHSTPPGHAGHFIYIEKFFSPTEQQEKNSVSAQDQPFDLMRQETAKLPSQTSNSTNLQSKRFALVTLEYRCDTTEALYREYDATDAMTCPILANGTKVEVLGQKGLRSHIRWRAGVSDFTAWLDTSSLERTD